MAKHNIDDLFSQMDNILLKPKSNETTSSPARGRGRGGASRGGRGGASRGDGGGASHGDRGGAGHGDGGGASRRGGRERSSQRGDYSALTPDGVPVSRKFSRGSKYKDNCEEMNRRRSHSTSREVQGGKFRVLNRGSHSVSASNPNIASGHCQKKNDEKLLNINFGYKRLQDLTNNKDSDEIVLHVCQNRNLFINFLQSKPRTDIINLLFKVMVKAIGTSFKENKLTLYALLWEKDFVDHLIIHVLSYLNVMDSKKVTEGFHLFENLNCLFEDLIMTVPSKAVESIDNLLTTVKMSVSHISQKDARYIKLVEKSDKLRDDLDLVKERWESCQAKPVKSTRDKSPPNDFRELSLHPTPEDFTQNNFLRHNIVDGSYEDPYHYLDVQFRLLREDFIEPLRQGISLYREKLVSPEARSKKNFNIRIYRKVRFLGVSYNFQKPGEMNYSVQLDREFCKKVRWEYSKRLLFGSLCLISKDDFETFQLATVADRNIKELSVSGIISLCLVGNNVFGKELMTTNFVMAESNAFYEPVYQVLNSLKNLSVEQLPMEKYLLVKDINPQRPSYTREGHVVKVENRAVIIDVDASWPPCEALGFNESQLSALKASLRNEFVIIQGPPGTGKTYLGLKLVKTLLNNFIFSGPILMVCYTNHALDQFLEGLLPVTNDIIRIGGQSKNEALNSFNYQEVRRQHRTMKNPVMGELKDLMRFSLEKVASFNKLMNDISNSIGVIDLLSYKEAKLKGLDTFENSVDFVSWLLCDMFEPLTYMMNECKPHKKQGLTESDLGNTLLQTNELDDLDEEEISRRRYVEAFDLDLEGLSFSTVRGKVSYCFTMDKLDDVLDHMQNILYELNSSGSCNEEKIGLISDIDMVQGMKTRLLDFLSQSDIKPSKRYSDLLKKNLWGIRETDRWALYHYWIRDLHSYISKEIVKEQTSYSEALNTMKELKVMEDYECLKRIKPKILGLTTTGAARHHLLLAALKPQVIVVEEAAEVLEAHIVVSLTNSCQHLILIGDHKQLKPNPSTFKLAKKYHLDISLFERMINNGVCCHTLNVQHRMKPNIASLIVPTIYPDLSNHHSVHDYPSVKGVVNNLFFIDHTFKEVKEEDMESQKNPHEGDFMISLCRYLLLQGYQPSDITILTTYSAQQFYLRDLKKRHSLMREVRITVVDNYQGEECKIILLSLVRSNDEGKIGFLGIENRICVALSRAKHGLYIIGNMTHLRDNSEIWTKIYGTLQHHNSIGESLALICQIHETVTCVKECKDFEQVMEGGCSLMCNRMMSCGHICPRLCHVIDVEHTEAKCCQPCNRVICEEVDHRCPLKCHEECKPCKVMMKRELPQCGHSAIIECYVEPSQHKCRTTVSDTKEDCKHPVDRYCFMDITKVRCRTRCDVRLDCGHACTLSCHVNDDPDHVQYKCMKDCVKKNVNCNNDHKCGKRCYEECGECVVKVKQTLACGHVHMIECSLDPASFSCRRPCQRTMGCEHRCKKLCFQPCGDCKQMVEKTIDECGHKVKLECRIPAKRSHCRAACQRTLACGHPCKLKCSQDCSLYKCSEYVDSPVQPACGHKGQVLCYKKHEYVDSTSDLLLRYCREPCGKELPCKDICRGTCGNCMQGRIHQVCNETCGNILICGHKCTVPCRDECPPCKRDCLFQCKHSVCRKNCGVPCVPCREKCDWGCKHSKCSKLCGELCDRDACYEPCDVTLPCGHPCVGFCGEPCPPLCRICDKETLCEILFGTEDEEDARFVFLNDCQHTLESSGLDAWFRVEPEQRRDREIGIRRCPKCNTNIITTQRYGSAIKETFKLVQGVKKKIFGANSAIWDTQNDLIKNLLPSLKSQVNRCPDFALKGSHLVEILQLMSKVERTNFRSRNRQNKLSIGEVKLYKYLCLYLTELLKSFLITIECGKSGAPVVLGLASKIKTRFDLLTYHLSKRKVKISTVEMQQFEMEFIRFKALVQFYKSISKVNSLHLTKESTVDGVGRIVSRFFSTRVFDYEANIAREIKTFLASVSSEAVYVEVSQQERDMIHKAMMKDFQSVTKQGHWFQCSNGHIYVITECGGAMQQGKCPECKETIGGSHHALVNTSRLAPSMDHASHAAWSSQNNMGFYQF